MFESISIVVPVYNEEENLELTVKKLSTYVKKLFRKYEIIIVDSNSSDRTPQIADRLVKKYPKVSVIHQQRRRGFGNGLRAGYKKCQYELVWYMDGDCPYDLRYLQQALPLIEKADAVVGVKTGTRESPSRWISSKGYNLLIRTCFGVDYRDINFSFKLLRRTALQKLTLKSEGWFIDAEILLELKRHGLRVKELEIVYQHREMGDSKVVMGTGLVIGMLKEMYAYIRRKGLRGNSLS